MVVKIKLVLTEWFNSLFSFPSAMNRCEPSLEQNCHPRSQLHYRRPTYTVRSLREMEHISLFTTMSESSSILWRYGRLAKNRESDGMATAFPFSTSACCDSDSASFNLGRTPEDEPDKKTSNSGQRTRGGQISRWTASHTPLFGTDARVRIPDKHSKTNHAVA